MLLFYANQAYLARGDFESCYCSANSASAAVAVREAADKLGRMPGKAAGAVGATECDLGIACAAFRARAVIVKLRRTLKPGRRGNASV